MDAKNQVIDFEGGDAAFTVLWTKHSDVNGSDPTEDRVDPLG